MTARKIACAALYGLLAFILVISGCVAISAHDGLYIARQRHNRLMVDSLVAERTKNANPVRP